MFVYYPDAAMGSDHSGAEDLREIRVENGANVESISPVHINA